MQWRTIKTQTQYAVAQTVEAGTQLIVRGNFPDNMGMMTQHTVAALGTAAAVVAGGVVTAVTTTADCITDPERHLPRPLYELLNTNITLALPAGIGMDRDGNNNDGNENDGHNDADEGRVLGEADLLSLLQSGAIAAGSTVYSYVSRGVGIAAAVVWTQVNARLQTLVDSVDATNAGVGTGTNNTGVNTGALNSSASDVAIAADTGHSSSIPGLVVPFHTPSPVSTVVDNGSVMAAKAASSEVYPAPTLTAKPSPCAPPPLPPPTPSDAGAVLVHPPPPSHTAASTPSAATVSGFSARPPAYPPPSRPPLRSAIPPPSPPRPLASALESPSAPADTTTARTSTSTLVSAGTIDSELEELPSTVTCKREEVKEDP